jgi:recombination protein RecT
MANVKGTDIQKKVENKNVTTLKQWFDEDDFRKKILSALPKVINRDAFITNAYNIYANDTKLQSCTIRSFLNSLMQAAKVGLMPNNPLGHCHIIPYKEKGVMIAHFQMGYPGYLELALRTNKYESIYAHAVYPQDEFKACYGLHKDLIHIPSEEPIPEGTMPTHYYAVYKLINGGYDFVYWTRDKVLKHRDRFSSGYNYAKNNNKKDSVWDTDEEIMGRKTMIIQVLKMAPKSTEMIRALSTEPEGEGYKEHFKDETPIDIDVFDKDESLEIDKEIAEEEGNTDFDYGENKTVTSKS